MVETVTPLALEVTLNVQQEMQSRWDEADRLRRLQVDRARYESELARRRFLRVDPDSRLVAASLEAAWNVKLRAWQRLTRITNDSVKPISSTSARRYESKFLPEPRIFLGCGTILRLQQLRRHGSDPEREGIKDRRRLVLKVNHGRLCSKSLWAEEPLRAPS